LKDYYNGIEACRKALNIKQNDLKLLILIGKLHLLCNDPDEAEIAFNKAAKVDANDPELILERAKLKK